MSRQGGGAPRAGAGPGNAKAKKRGWGQPAGQAHRWASAGLMSRPPVFFTMVLLCCWLLPGRCDAYRLRQPAPPQEAGGGQWAAAAAVVVAASAVAWRAPCSGEIPPAR